MRARHMITGRLILGMCLPTVSRRLTRAWSCRAPKQLGRRELYQPRIRGGLTRAPQLKRSPLGIPFDQEHL